MTTTQVRNTNSIYYLAPSFAASFVLGEFGPDHLEVAITLFKVIQGHQFWCQSKAHMRLPISD